jgi:hypothetical protein
MRGARSSSPCGARRSAPMSGGKLGLAVSDDTNRRVLAVLAYPQGR